jgi:hypothetical protein
MPLIVAGCAIYTSSVRPDTSPRPGSAYLYGRFYINADLQYDALLGSKPSMGLVIRCDSGSTYTFGSTDTREVQVLEIRPSRCWLVKALLADADRIVRKELPVDPAVQRPLDFTAGRAHYLGDYFARGNYSASGSMQYWAWDMAPAEDRYESTTAEMKRSFPNLASLPSVDTRLIPARPRKRGNGIKAAPGEPPLSPERVAGLAAFIKRDYATPALCETACPAGQCLPYRSETGPVIACVIRCDKNADCPSGMACNCPNSEQPPGPECHPIASTPRDPMSRVCVTPQAIEEP